MRNKVIPKQPDVALNRVLAGLEKELVDATDQEIVQAAEDLGMNVKMKGSAAFIGVKYTLPKSAAEIFDLEDLRRFYVQHVLKPGAVVPKAGRKPRSYLAKTGRKDRDDDK